MSRAVSAILSLEREIVTPAGRAQRGLAGVHGQGRYRLRAPALSLALGSGIPCRKDGRFFHRQVSANSLAGCFSAKRERGNERKNAGFTLIEIIVVLVIAAAALALVAPNLGGALARNELTAATREIASGLRYVRGHAMASGRPAEFWLDVRQHRYSVGDKPKPRGLPASVKLTLITADTQASRDGRGFVRFFPDGSSTGGKVLLEAAGDKRLVEINWLTGYVRIVGPADG
jgi:general secretion pathway protein H